MAGRLRCMVFTALLAMPLLSGCTLPVLSGAAGPSDSATQSDGAAVTGAGVATETAANPITGDAIAVTPLDAAPAATAPKPAPEPAQAPPTEDAPPPEDAAPEETIPEALKPPEQIACEKTKGTWSIAGKSGARACVHQTRDGGDRCTRESDCEGVCLARSGSCSPLTPLFGCNEILQDNGARVTLCID